MLLLCPLAKRDRTRVHARKGGIGGGRGEGKREEQSVRACGGEGERERDKV